MTKSLRELAESAGVDHVTILNIIKRRGFDSKTLTDEQADIVYEDAKETAMLTKTTKEKASKSSKGFKPKLRRIDETDDSSVLAMLQDCKEQYVKNEGFIQRLQYEIDQQDSLMHGNGNGTLSALPQLTIMEKYLKINISLRNQIVALEEEVGRRAEPRKEDDPFE